MDVWWLYEVSVGSTMAEPAEVEAWDARPYRFEGRDAAVEGIGGEVRATVVEDFRNQRLHRHRAEMRGGVEHFGEVLAVAAPHDSAARPGSAYTNPSRGAMLSWSPLISCSRRNGGYAGSRSAMAPTH
jgi:hypothetical protein